MASQIIYPIFSGGGLQGGQKMILRHIETLRDLGFDACGLTTRANRIPTWFEHRAPIAVDEPLDSRRHVVAVPDDALNTLRQFAALDYRIAVFVQNQFNFARTSLEILELFRDDNFPTVLTVSFSAARTVSRACPRATVRMARAFADERTFRPGPERQDAIALSPRKRPSETAVIRNLFPRLHPTHAELPWRPLEGVSEAEVAATFGASTVCLSLSRLESLGMTPLEAMASGCVCAGFTGVGGRDFATPENGFWVADDDCLAAVDALAQAADLVRTGGPALKRQLEAGFETARQWSYAAFRRELEAFWMEFAPDARLRNGPLD